MSRAHLVVVAALVLLLSSGSTAAPAASRYRFADVTRAVGIEKDRTRTWGSVWGDYDNDGDTDLFVNRHQSRPRLYVNQDGNYSLFDGDDIFFPNRVDRHGCAWGESNGDGRLDLYCTQGANRGEGTGPNQLFEQTDDGFVDRARAAGVRDRFARGRTINWIDFDSDRDLDMFVGNERRAGAPNVMFRNTAAGFRRASVGVEDKLHTVSSSSSDWDTDGDPDLLVFQHPEHGYPAVAYKNDEGSFRRISLPRVTGRFWRSGAWGDFNADGHPDLHLMNKERALLLRNTGHGFKREHSMRVRQGRMSEWLDVENDGDLDLFVLQGAKGSSDDGNVNHRDFLLIRKRGRLVKVTGRSFAGPRGGNGDGVAAGDHDRDGRMDLFVTNGYGRSPWKGRSILLENRSRAGRWLGVDLEGPRKNPAGFGAKIRVRTAVRTYRREVTDGFNYLVQSDRSYAHFGIGRARKANVKVRWPGGATDCRSVEHGRIRRITKGDHPCP